MYKQTQTETVEEAIMENAVFVTPIATLRDEWGGTCHIINDDHCYVLCLEQEDGSCRKSTHIFKEAFEVLKQLPAPH